MKLNIRSVQDLGIAIRAARKSSHIRIDDFAMTAGVSKQFMSDLEHGKPTVQAGKVLELLQALGLPLTVEIPDSAVSALDDLTAKQRKEFVVQEAPDVSTSVKRSARTTGEKKGSGDA